MADQGKKYVISAGPSREELFDGLRLRHEHRKVVFTVVRDASYTLSSTLAFVVDKIGVEDGSGNNWLIDLYDANSTLGAKRLGGYFNTVSRKGWLVPNE